MRIFRRDTPTYDELMNTLTECRRQSDSYMEKMDEYRERMIAAQKRVRELEKRTPENVERMCHQLPGHGGMHSAFNGDTWPTGKPPAYSVRKWEAQGWSAQPDGLHWNPPYGTGGQS